MIHALDAAVAVRMIGTCPNFARAEELANSARQLGAELEAVVGEKTNGASPEWDVLLDKNVGGPVGREFSCGNGVHVCAPAETVGEKKNGGIPLNSPWG